MSAGIKVNRGRARRAIWFCNKRPKIAVRRNAICALSNAMPIRGWSQVGIVVETITTIEELAPYSIRRTCRGWNVRSRYYHLASLDIRCKAEEDRLFCC